jgi:hypothetical protein
MKNNKHLSQEQGDKLLKICKPVLKKTGIATKILTGRKFKPNLIPIPTNCGRLTKWKKPAENRMRLVTTKKPANSFFMTARRKAPKDAETFVTTRKHLKSRKKIKPKNSAVGMAQEMGIELLTEGQYRELQQLGEFDTKTSSWVVTPPEVRELGGALFGDRRFGKVFIYHNGAESYYGARGFRGSLKV